MRVLSPIAGFAVGLIVVGIGTALTIHGIEGSTRWTAKLLGVAESAFGDVTVGTILVIIGFIVIFAVSFHPNA